MELTNFWWLLLWPLLFGGFNVLFIAKRREYVQGTISYRWHWVPAIILVLPYLFWAAWRSNHYGDTGVYRGTFLDMPTGFSEMASYVASRSKGKGFVVLEYLFKTIISQSDVAFFFVLALIQLFFLVRIYRKYSRNYWLSIFFFVASTDYLSWMQNGVRQFLAVTLIFTSLPLIIKKKYMLMCFVVLGAALIHSSALIFLPFVFIINGRAWNRRTILYIIGLVLAVIFISRISGFIVDSMENTVYEGDIEIYLSDDGTNIFRVLFYAVPTILAWVFRPYINEVNDPLINMCVNLSVVSTGVYIFSMFTSGILIGALPIYFSLANYLLLPWIIMEVFKERSVVIMEIVFVIAYSAFFYYQCGPTWGLL